MQEVWAAQGADAGRIRRFVSIYRILPAAALDDLALR